MPKQKKSSAPKKDYIGWIDGEVEKIDTNIIILKILLDPAAIRTQLALKVSLLANKAVLLIHAPRKSELSDEYLECSTCIHGDYNDDFPCATYKAITDHLDELMANG